MNDLIHTNTLNEEEYNEILQQAVAVIESSRVRLAKYKTATGCRSFAMESQFAFDEL
jgi:hypothetical protein